jgi:Uma2 family endonuclease
MNASTFDQLESRAFAPGAWDSERLFRVSVATYHEMIRDNILGEDDPVELIEGLLVKKMPKNPPHTVATTLLRRAFEALLPPDWFTNEQAPVTTPDSEPEPDLSIVRGQPRDHLAGHPTADNTALIVEISSATLSFDRGPKKRVYARAGFGVYWIVNLIDRSVEIYQEPSGPCEQPDYARGEIVNEDGVLPVLIEGKPIGAIAVREILP